MKPPPPYPDEDRRLTVLRDYELSFEPSDPQLDDLVALAAGICDTPIAVISIVEEHRQRFKSQIGLAVNDIPRDIAICAHAIHYEQEFVLPDALADDRFSDNPLVQGESRIRFYSGRPLRSPCGAPLGMLAVLDHVPRDLSPVQNKALRILSHEIMGHLNNRRLRAGWRKIGPHLNWSLGPGRGGLATLDKGGTILEINSEGLEISEAELEGQSSARSIYSLLPPELRGHCASLLERMFQGSSAKAVLQVDPFKGTTRLLEAKAALFRDAQGMPLELLGGGGDTTARNEEEALVAARLKRFKQLARMSVKLSGDPSQVFEQIVRMIDGLFMVPSICISIIEGELAVVKAMATSGKISTEPAAFPLDATPCGLVARTKSVQIVNNIQDLYPQIALFKEMGLRGYCGIPALDGEGNVLATICLLSREPHQLEPEDLEFLELLGRRVAEELERDKAANLCAERDSRLMELGFHHNFFRGVHQLVMRERDTRLLLEGACRMAVEESGFTSVWMGLFDSVGGGTTRLAAHATSADCEHGLLAAQMEDFLSGHSPALSLALSGLPAVVEIPPGGQEESESTQAQHSGCAASFAVVPLAVGGAVAGLVAFHSREANYFDERRLSVLVEVAEDLSFAISCNDQDQKRGQLERVVEASLNEIYLFDAETLRFDYVNECARENLGYSQTELLAMTPLDLKPCFTPDSFRELLKPLLEGGKTKLCFQTLHKRAAGGSYPVEVHLQLLEGDGRRQFLAVINDITERQRVEDSLQQKCAALDAAANAIMITGRDGRIQWVNPAFCKLSGYMASEAVGQRPSLVKSEHHSPAFYKDLWETILGGRVWRGQVTDRDKNGRHYVSEQTISPVFGAMGEVTHFISVQQDVTAQKLIEVELRRKTAILEAQVAASPDGILILDSKGNIIVRNAKLDEVWSILPPIRQDSHYRPLFQLFLSRCKGRGPLAFEHFNLTTHQKAVYDEEFELEDGTILVLRSLPIGEVGGEDYGRIWVFSDITKTRQLEDSFRQSQKMDAFGQLAGGVAHDFNNILTAIMMETELSLMDPSLSEESRASLGGIKSASDRAANLTRQLLLFSRRQVIHRTNLDLNVVVENMAKMLRRILGEDVALELRIWPQPLAMLADAGMLDQVLLNLVVNARDAMPDGGKLTIETGDCIVTEEEADSTLDATPGHHLWLRVTDTGKGIPPEVLGRVFEPFFTTKPVGKGTGLGLATVFGIVKQHKGFITVESQVGCGTAFVIFFPASDQAPTPSGSACVEPAPTRGTETILVAEDEAEIRALIRSALERAGYGVVEAKSGVEALELWERHADSVHLLLTDMVMPGGVSGKELSRRLLARNPDLKVIFLSGYSSELAGVELILTEGQCFIEKPPSLKDLLAAVRRLLDQRVD